MATSSLLPRCLSLSQSGAAVLSRTVAPVSGHAVLRVGPSSRRVISSHAEPSRFRASYHEPYFRNVSSASAVPAPLDGHARGGGNAADPSVEVTPPPAAHGQPVVRSDAHGVGVTWASGIESTYHNIWLRDHCRCSQCYHPKTKQRLLNTFQIPPDISPLAAESTTEGLQILWPSGTSPEGASPTLHDSESASHYSLYPWRWLMNHSYSPELAKPPGRSNEAGERTLWGKGIAAAPPTVPYEAVMESDEGVLRWLNKIAQFGFSFVSGVPATPEATEALIRRIAFIRETHYGGFWDFTSNLEHGDTAYTNLALQAHTDTTYFTDPAGLQMFHLLSHKDSPGGSKPQGGESLLVDGFLAAKVLKDVHPDAYTTLSRIRLSTHSAGDDDTLVRPLLASGYPILQHDDASGELVLVRYNNDDRSVLHVDEDNVEPFYDALRKWNEVLTSKDGEYWQQLEPGNALIFDNHRVLHGRSAFVGERRLCGAYVSHDDYRSRLAVLRSRFGASADLPAAAAAAARGAAGKESRSRGVWDDGL